MYFKDIIEELNNLNENTKGKKIKDILFGNNKKYVHTFAIISAENPDGKILDDLVNRQRSNQFRKHLEQIRYKRLNDSQNDIDDSMKFELNGMHCQYIKLLGSYGELEHSFFVINISLNEVKNLAKEFGQKAFWFCKYINNKNAECSYYEYRDNDYTCLETSDVIINAEKFDNFFSQRGKFKFSIWTKLFNEEYNFKFRNILDEEALLDSISDDNYTTKYRIQRRIKSYKN